MLHIGGASVRIGSVHFGDANRRVFNLHNNLNGIEVHPKGVSGASQLGILVQSEV